MTASSALLSAGTSPANVVYRDDLCCTFLDIQPVNPGHLPVVPNDHAMHLADLPPVAGGRTFQVARDLAGALRRNGFRGEGVNLFLADGATAMQEVFHVHLRVFPRFAGDGFALSFGPGSSHKPRRAKLDEVADQFRVAAG